MPRIPKSLEVAIEQNPERFADYLDPENISDKDSFMEEFYDKFSQSTQGQNLLHWANKKTLDAIYKTNRVSGAISKAGVTKSHTIYPLDVTRFKEKQQVAFDKAYSQQLEEIKLARSIKTGDYTRSGKSVEGYSRGRHVWGKKEIRFLENRLDVSSNKALAFEFNNFFDARISRDSIKAMKLRLRGTKKR